MKYKTNEPVKLSVLETDIRADKITPISPSLIFFQVIKMKIEVAEESRGTLMAHTVSAEDANKLYSHFKKEFDDREELKRSANRKAHANQGQIDDVMAVIKNNNATQVASANYQNEQILNLSYAMNYFCRRFQVSAEFAISEGKKLTEKAK